jgi:HD-GYP domain-containing protein (c-di-GMP phosphodiesterase class II)
MDSAVLGTSLRNIERARTGHSQKRRVPIAPIDLRAGEKLEFEISLFLVANNKYIKINHAGRAIEERQLSKLKHNAANQVFIDEEQLPQYFKFIAGQMKSWTADVEKLRDATRKLFRELLSPTESLFEEGRGLIESVTQIVNEFIGSREVANIRSELFSQANSAPEGLYELSQRVAAMAGLLALGTRRCRPADVIMAALFSELAYCRLPQELREADCSQLSQEQLAQVHSHPSGSLAILAAKRMVVLPAVREAVMQHHERADGHGYPQALPGFKIKDEAQILSFASQLEVHMRVVAGKARPTLKGALDVISRNGSIRQEILGEIRDLLIDRSENSPTVQSA